MSRSVSIDTARYFGSAAPGRLADPLAITVTPKSFPPYLDDLSADWLASVGIPALRILARRRGRVAGFCSIGTGTGLDALGAIEVFAPELVGITDVDEEIVAAARANIEGNLRGASPTLLAGVGDLLSPLAAHAPKFDVIYENLPNVPSSATAEQSTSARISSNFFGPRAEEIPAEVQAMLLSLHYLALLQSRDFLVPGGVVLSMLGARVPLGSFLAMSERAGYRASFLAYGWKLQAEADEILRGHLDWQRRGLGPFHFHRLEDLREVFAGLSPEEAAPRALEIEARLARHALDAEAALALHQSGTPVGHTYAVLYSELPR